jgi:hypothetical protein
MGNRELCMALMRADSESEVIGLLKEAGYWDSPWAWRYIGDYDGNWSTIGNQQSDPVPALTEKFVNAIDAVLINACLETGTDPKGSGVPATMREAVATFFEHAPNPKADHVGRISAWTDAQIREQARRITLAATGNTPSKGAPCLSIADVGEGQAPDWFPDTFMSIQKRNKVDIPFVQGKFNMGGTGALWFCGTHKLQLTVSRRNPSLLPTDHTSRDEEWGFTVTRRERTGARSSVVTYLAPIDADQDRKGAVLSFEAATFPILPEATSGSRDAYSRDAEHGTLVKLYEYDVSPRSNIVFTRRGLRQKIETSLPELALPVGVFECRKGFRGEEARSYFTPARGTATRLDQEKNEELLEFDPLGAVLNLDGNNILVKVHAFKRRPGQKKQDGFLVDYAHGGGVLYTVNGQTHKQSGNEFFTRSAVDLDYLKDDLLVTVDCSGVDEITREDLFMNSRDRNRVTPLWKQLERMVERFLKQNETLRELAVLRREQAVRDKTEDNRALADLLGRVLVASPDLAQVLLGGIRLPSPFPKPGTGARRKAKAFRGKKFPTYFHFEKHQAGEDHKRRAELGRDVRIAFTTDAQDDYFWRSADHGSMSVTLAVNEAELVPVTGSSLTLASGVARWIGQLPDDARVGDVFTYEFVVTDPAQTEPFRNRLVVEVTQRVERSGSGGRRRKRSDSGEGNDDADSGLSLPDVVPVTRDEWNTYGFDESSALLVRRAGDAQTPSSYDFFYNVHNDSLLRAQKAEPREAELTRERFRCALVLVGLALIQESTTKVNRARQDGGEEADGTSVEELVTLTTRALAPVLLPMIEMIGALSAGPDA